MKIGYIRVSTEEQNTARQEALLRELGVDEVFVDKASGKNADRPELWRVIERYFGEKTQKRCRNCCRCRQKSD